MRITDAPKTAVFYVGLGLLLMGAMALKALRWCALWHVGAWLMTAGTWLVCWTRSEDGSE